MAKNVNKEIRKKIIQATETKSIDAIEDAIENISEAILSKKLKIFLVDSVTHLGYRPNHNHPIPVIRADSSHQLVLNTSYALNRRDSKKMNVKYLQDQDADDAYRWNELSCIRNNIGGIFFKTKGACIEEVFNEEDYFNPELILDSFSQFYNYSKNNGKNHKQHFIGGTVRVSFIENPDMLKTNNKLFSSSGMREASFETTPYNCLHMVIEGNSKDCLKYQKRGYSIIREIFSSMGKIECASIPLREKVDTRNFPFETLFIACAGNNDRNSRDGNNVLSYRFLFHKYI